MHKSCHARDLNYKNSEFLNSARKLQFFFAWLCRKGVDRRQLKISKFALFPISTTFANPFKIILCKLPSEVQVTIRQNR